MRYSEVGPLKSKAISEQINQWIFSRVIKMMLKLANEASHSKRDGS